MRTLEEVRDRCRVDEDTGCWLWKGALSAGVPRIYAPDWTRCAGEMRSQAGRRAVWHITKGYGVPGTWRVYGTCDHDTCLNPEHAKCGPMADLGKLIRKTGKLKGKVSTMLAARALGRRRSVLTRDTYAEILASEETGIAIAERLGISDTVVSNVRTGNQRAFQPIGGFLSGLMGAMNG